MTKMVNLLDVKMCVGCRFHDITLIRDGNGNVRALDECKRRDCDNHRQIANPRPEEQVAEVLD